MSVSILQIKYKQYRSLLDISQDLIDVWIGLFVLFQLIGQMSGNYTLMALKPIPIILMIAKSIYLVDCHVNIIRGLFFSLLGDLLLMFHDLTLFKIGTVCFMIAHFFYICAFLRNFKTLAKATRRKQYFSMTMTILVIIFLIFNNYMLWDVLPDKVLFPFYSVILTTMASSSLYRYHQQNHDSYSITIVGAMLFMISDSIIAHTKLSGFDSKQTGTLIMGLYYVGQYCILRGMSSTKLSIPQPNQALN